MNIKIPPFYVGQEVVANCNHSQGAFKKGDEFIVKHIEWICCNWVIDIGIRSNGARWHCGYCNHTGYYRYWAMFSKCFSPKIQIGEFVSMREVVSLETVGAN